MIVQKRRHYATRTANVCLAIVTAFAWGTSVAHSEEPPYTVSVLADVAEGGSILAKDYERAISRLESRRARGIDLFFVANNLCVAYLKSGRLDDAKLSCDTAVTTMESLLESPRSSFANADQAPSFGRYLALALSNRGVALAMSGATEQARADFTLALEVKPDAREPEGNLTRLEMAG